MPAGGGRRKRLKLVFSVPFSLLHFFWASKRNEEANFINSIVSFTHIFKLMYDQCEVLQFSLFP
jgi:hypothetical protein